MNPTSPLQATYDVIKPANGIELGKFIHKDISLVEDDVLNQAKIDANEASLLSEQLDNWEATKLVHKITVGLNLEMKTRSDRLSSHSI